MLTQMIRTTVYLPTDLVQLAKLAALEEGSSLTGLIKESLEVKLDTKKKVTKKIEWLGKKIGAGKVTRDMAYEI